MYGIFLLVTLDNTAVDINFFPHRSVIVPLVAHTYVGFYVSSPLDVLGSSLCPSSLYMFLLMYITSLVFALCSHSRCRSEFRLLVVKWAVIRLTVVGIVNTVYTTLSTAFHVVLSFPCWNAPIVLSDVTLPFLGLVMPVSIVFLCSCLRPKLFQLLLPASHNLHACVHALLPFPYAAGPAVLHSASGPGLVLAYLRWPTP